MTANEQIIQAIFNAIDDVNMERPIEEQLEKSEDTLLFGSTGKLDSLGIVNLIVAIEENLEEALGIPLSLADERALSQETSPFQSVQTLKNYISGLIEEHAN